MTRWERFYYGVVAVALIAGLSACSTARTLYHACRDGHC